MNRQRDRRILIIDDEPRAARLILVDLNDDEVIALHPDDLKRVHLQEASLVLVDHHLEQAQWPSRSRLPFGCQPQDGRAFAAIMQAYLRLPEFRDYPPTAVALLSGMLSEVTPDLDGPPPEDLAARACGLDWAFAKSAPGDGDLSARVRSFANAVRALPPSWPTTSTGGSDTVARLFGLETQDWKGIALSQAERCHPPVHEFASWTRGMAFLRWLAQIILPYRTFLLDRDHLAIRLGVSPSWLASTLDVKPELSKEMESARYTGVLAGLQDARWWLAGVDALLWRVTNGRSIDSDAVRGWLAALVGEQPQALTDQETLVLGDDFRFSGVTAPYSECVRVWPDHWPSFAEQPWSTVEAARRSDRLRAVVVAEDLERLAVDEA